MCTYSTSDKKQERLQEAMGSYTNLMKYFPESKFKDDAGKLAEKIQEELSAYTISK